MNSFELACEEVEHNRDYELSQENAISFLKGSDTATVTFSQGRYITRIKKLAEKYPDEVQICSENKDGSIVAHIPTKYIKISANKSNMTEEQKIANAERLKNYHKNTEIV